VRLLTRLFGFGIIEVLSPAIDLHTQAGIMLILIEGKCVKEVPTKGENINITWSPDGNHVAVASKVGSRLLSLVDVG
jgi:WD40-like Beta Propeller Repeat